MHIHEEQTVTPLFVLLTSTGRAYPVGVDEHGEYRRYSFRERPLIADGGRSRMIQSHERSWPLAPSIGDQIECVGGAVFECLRRTGPHTAHVRCLVNPDDPQQVGAVYEAELDPSRA